MNLYKTIIQGRIDFGTEKSFQKVMKMFIYRSENYHKSDIIFTSEEIFFFDQFALIIPRFVGKTTEMSWRNTASLLKYCAQFGISGQVRAWQTDNGVIINYAYIEPDSEKGAVLQFRKGKNLVDQKGKEQEALDALTEAIEKYNRNAQAYERRGYVNYMLRRYHDANRDYCKALKIDHSIPDAYFGRAKIHIINANYEEAIADLEMSLKSSIALQSIYWQSRRLKAECHIIRKEYEKAAFDLKLFTKRKFKPDNLNYPWKKQAFYDYGGVLLELEQYVEALEAVESALEITEKGYGKVKEADLYLRRGIIKQKSGKSGFIADLKKAADLGLQKAKTLLKSYA